MGSFSTFRIVFAWLAPFHVPVGRRYLQTMVFERDTEGKVVEALELTVRQAEDGSNPPDARC